MKIIVQEVVLKVFAAVLGACLLISCAPEKAEENTPAVRQQLDDVQLRLDAANTAAEDRLKEACAENPDC